MLRTTLALLFAIVALPATSAGEPVHWPPQLLARVPEAARGPALPEGQGWLLEEIRGGLYWLTDGHYQMMFLVTDAGVVVMDAPASLAGVIPAAIASVTDQPVTHLVYSHFHKDHIGAAHVLPAGISIVAHNATALMLEAAADPNRPLPTASFDDRDSLRVGGREIRLHYPGPNHDVGNIIIHVPHARTAMIVDVVWPGWVPFHSVGVADHIPGIFTAMDALLAMDFDTLVGGHANRMGTPRDVEVQREYLLDVRAAAEQAYAEVDLDALIARFGWEHRWHIFDVYFEQMSAYCNDAVVPKWIDRLGDANRFTRPNCLAVGLSLWMD
jgi:glyoxylase-like metal-dependent hydrolase (beta-lactamase superfamily II)